MTNPPRLTKCLYCGAESYLPWGRSLCSERCRKLQQARHSTEQSMTPAQIDAYLSAMERLELMPRYLRDPQPWT